ncbi:MAG: hypothetical protein AMXMBFR57_21570 [Acidimicrobiia bacterium]|jgi:serine acetyltransferase
MTAAILVRQLQQKAKRDANLPFRIRLSKGLRYLRELATARVYLRNLQRVGARVRTLGRPRLLPDGHIEIGDDVVLRSVMVPVELGTGHRGRLVIGDKVSINYGTSIFAQHAITIGDRVRIGPFVSIADTDFHDAHDRNKRPDGLAIHIDDDAWIGTRALILKGIRIGKGAIVAAGSVVTRDVAPFAVVAGVPAKVVRTLDRDKFVPQDTP